MYWYEFQFNGQRVRESTLQRNDKVAGSMESAHRISLAKGELGLLEKKPIPTLAAFLADRILPWAEATFGATRRNGLDWYPNEARALNEYKPLANSPLDGITSELLAGFAARRIK